MFLLQGLLGALMLIFGFILNAMRTGIDRVNIDLRGLNDAVLGKYMTRDESENKWAVHRSETDSKWQTQRTLDHELRQMIQETMIDIAKVKGVPYNYQRPAPNGVTD